ncbi:MAG: hypothetical protein KatS3mg053_0240 [Candidatus Roseilinea sp.]|nr:MAG: hypothetical protein KatS3mg053_0240 [Candidatus Roseilinea sp.]
MKALQTMIRTELKLYLREPAAFFFTLLFPVLLVVVAGYSWGAQVVFTTERGLEVRVLDVMLPTVLVFIVANQGLMGLYPYMTSLRESRALKYYRTHPIRPRHLFIAQYITGLVLWALALALLLPIEHLLFGLRYEGATLMVFLSLLLVYSAFFVLGFGLAGVTPTARVAQAAGSLIFFPMVFLGGGFGPREGLPPFLKFVSDLLPMTFANDLLTDLWLSGPLSFQEALRLSLHSYTGTAFLGRTWFAQVTVGHALLYLLAMTLVFGFLALRSFRWGDERAPLARVGRSASPSSEEDDAVIRVEGLVKTYGPVHAVDGLSFTVRRGEIFGILGPNGAGKTTTLECLEGLRVHDAGSLQVLDLNPLVDYDRLVHRIGVQLQEASLPSRLKVREIFALFAAFCERTLPVEMLLERLGLKEQANTFFGKLSGGQKQRVFAALALLNDPEVVFLDEITTGLDAHIRRDIWAFLQELRRQGKTIILTSHYLEEAQALCDRVVILDRGKAVAQGRPLDLVQALAWAFRLEVEPLDTAAVPADLAYLPGVRRVSSENGALVLELAEPSALEQVLAALRSHGVGYRAIRARAASLEDVFLACTRQQPAS